MSQAVSAPSSNGTGSDSVTVQLAQWASRVCYEDIPPSTVAFARSQLISNLATVRASLNHPLGHALVKAFGAPTQRDPKQSAYVLSGLAMSLDFDEVAYSGHLSASCVSVAISYAIHLGVDGERLLSAIVVANECAARFQAATILGPFFRPQSATHLHLVGAVAARLHLQGASEDEWVAALSLAVGILPTPSHRAVLCSDTKTLIAATPVRIALDACDAAAQGMSSTSEILDGPDGVLAQISPIPMPEAVVAQLGWRWHTDTLSFKRFPGSMYLQAAFECAERLHTRLGADTLTIRNVIVYGSVLTAMLDKKVAPSIGDHRPAVSAATFSIGYGVATLLLEGALGPEDFAVPALDDTERWALARKVRVVEDPRLTKRMVGATAPLGEALRQAGKRASESIEILTWGSGRFAFLLRVPFGRTVFKPLIARRVRARLAGLGPTADTFETATMAIGARVEVELTNGSVLTEECDVAIGMAGPATKRDHAAIVRAKFLGVGGSVAVLSDLERIDQMDCVNAVRTLTTAIETDEYCSPRSG
jgi:2-methylcitrate dehydratase PrpD